MNGVSRRERGGGWSFLALHDPTFVPAKGLISLFNFIIGTELARGVFTTATLCASRRRIAVRKVEE